VVEIPFGWKSDTLRLAVYPRRYPGTTAERGSVFSGNVCVHKRHRKQTPSQSTAAQTDYTSNVTPVAIHFCSGHCMVLADRASALLFAAMNAI
jgi:hypothetical protein